MQAQPKPRKRIRHLCMGAKGGKAHAWEKALASRVTFNHEAETESREVKQQEEAWLAHGRCRKGSGREREPHVSVQRVKGLTRPAAE